MQEKLPEKNITNFTKDWNDGTNIAGLVDAKAPGLCPEHKGMDPKNALQNATHAMKLAEDWLNIPMVSSYIHNWTTSYSGISDKKPLQNQN